MLGNAMFTIVASRKAMNAASEHTTSTARTRPDVIGAGLASVAESTARSSAKPCLSADVPARTGSLVSTSAGKRPGSDRDRLWQTDLRRQPLGGVCPARNDRRALHVRGPQDRVVQLAARPAGQACAAVRGERRGEADVRLVHLHETRVADLLDEALDDRVV